MNDAIPLCDPVAELASGNFGHGRRTGAVVKVAQGLMARPGVSFPEMYNRKDLECAYRIFGNDQVSWGTLLDAHVRATAARCSGRDVVLVVHDTTEIGFKYRGGHLREGFTKLSAKRQGFFLHTSMAVLPNGGLPLGVVAAQPHVHQSQLPDDDTRELWAEMGGLYDNEQQRWSEAVDHADEVLAGAALVHLMDSEGDAYETIYPMLAKQHRFVVRAQQDHRRTSEGNLADVVSAQPVLSRRTLDVQVRHESKGKGASKRNGARQSRRCEVAIRACAVELKRPVGLDSTLPKTLRLHVVDVHEIDPPSEKDQIRWTLFTTEPIETAHDVELVVDYYCSRWLIEEFFKAVKTGCLAEARQLDSVAAYLTFLAMALPVAVKMLQLRTLARTDDHPIGDLISPVQKEILATHPRARLPAQPRASHYLYAIAALGGHLKNNGAPGWLTLYRGFAALAWLESGWIAAHERGSAAKSPQESDQS